MYSDDDLDDSRDVFFTSEEYQRMSCRYYKLIANLDDIHEFRNELASIKEVKRTDDDFQRNQGHNIHFTQRTPTETGKGLATLSVFEHKTYLELKSKYIDAHKPVKTPADYQDIQLLADLEKKIEKERKKVSEYLYNSACTTRRQDYYFIHHEAKKYITAVLKEELKYCLQYERFYSAEKIIPLLIPGIQVKDTPFSFIKVVLKLGHVPPLLVPTATNRCIMTAKCDVLIKQFPPSEIGSDNVHPSKQHITKDTIASDLAVKYKADAIITLESLKTLMDNIHPNYEHSWEIPVVVCECQDASGDPLRCVYIEKAIPPSSLSVRAKYELYYNYAVKFKFSETFHVKRRKSCYSSPVIPDNIQPVSEQVQAEVDKKISDLTSFEDVCESSEKVCELDTFGISSPKKQPSHSKVSPEEQNTVHDKNQTTSNTSADSDSCSDEECVPCDEEFLSNMKGMMMKMLSSSKAEKDTASNEEEIRVSNEDIKKEDDVKSSNSSPCMSPVSNADSEQDGLVIDCDTEEKQADLLVPSAPEKEAPTSDKTCVKSEFVVSEKFDLVKKQEIHVDSDDSGIIRKKKKLSKLSSDSDDSDFKNVIHIENSFKTEIIEESHQSCDSKSLKTEKLHLTKTETDNENAAQKDNLGNTVSSTQKGPLDEILMSQHKMLNPADKIDDDTEMIVPSQFSANADLMDEIRKLYPPLSQHENVLYSLWRLGDLKLVIRSEVDSQIRTTGRPFIPAFLFPKLEYQMKFGYEITTHSELLRQWLVLYTHPGSHLIKVRIDAPETKLSLLEEISLPILRKYMTDFNLQVPIHQLYIILDTLKNLPEGQYLLSHKKNESVLILQKAVDEAKHGAYDLHSSIEQRLECVDNQEDEDPTRKDVPWLPIDPTMTLPEQKRQDRIPGCFYPSGFKKKFHQRSENKP